MNAVFSILILILIFFKNLKVNSTPVSGGLEKKLHLKVPKCEIFDRSDFPDFYTIKSLRVGDFGVKIKIFFKNI
jgi:hypothetical protein